MDVNWNPWFVGLFQKKIFFFHKKMSTHDRAIQQLNLLLREKEENIREGKRKYQELKKFLQTYPRPPQADEKEIFNEIEQDMKLTEIFIKSDKTMLQSLRKMIETLERSR